MIILATVLAVVIVFFVSGTIMAPESPQFSDGDEISLEGSLTCLPHKNQDGPQTMECAIGFIDTDGNYYGVRDTTPEQSFIMGIEHGKEIKIGGIFKAESSDTYQQEGVIEIKGLAEGTDYIVD